MKQWEFHAPDCRYIPAKEGFLKNLSNYLFDYAIDQQLSNVLRWSIQTMKLLNHKCLEMQNLGSQVSSASILICTHLQFTYLLIVQEVYYWTIKKHWCILYSDSKWNWLLNGGFTTISGHFFTICMFIFHKTEVQTVILRCFMVLNLNWFKSYDTKCTYFHFRFFAILYKNTH